MGEVRRGKTSAGLALGGAITGLALPMSSALASSVTLIDFAIWGVVALLLQLIVYRLVDLLLGGLPRRIEEDEALSLIRISEPTRPY